MIMTYIMYTSRNALATADFTNSPKLIVNDRKIIIYELFLPV